MANNPNVNKVVYGNQTVMDITDTTAEPETVLEGEVFYDKSGTRRTGSAVIPDISNCYQTTDTAETAIADNDYFPFYDTSATAKRKTLWSNIKAKLKAYFDGIYSTFSGSYNDLTDKPTIPAAQVNSDWNANSGVAEILNKPSLATVATSGSYNDLSNKPTIPAAQIQSDWNQTTTTAKDFIKNKPTIPAAQIQSDWNQTTTSAKDYIKNKPTIYKKGVYYGTCTSQAANQTKAVTIAATQGFTLEAGATIYVKFDANNTYSATAAAPVKLNVNNTGAKNVYYGGSSAPTGTNTTVFGRANYINQYIYDGTYWVWTGSSADNNTTYSAMSASELTTGTATTSRSVRADYLKSGINSLIDAKVESKYDTNDDTETDLQDGDFVPFYDDSASAKKKTAWSNIKAKLKAYFDTVYATLASPAFTGTPTAPTAYTSTATSQIATTSFVHNVTASKYDHNDPYTSTLSDDDTHIPILNTSGEYTSQRTKLGNIRPVFIVRTGLTATAGTTIRIPASGTNEFITYGCHVEPVCDSQAGKGIKYDQIACHDYEGQAGYVEIRLAQSITNRTIGIKVIGR